MRELLFRAKRRDNREWVEGLPSYGPDGKITELECLKKASGEEIPEIEYIEIDPGSICQYTGLTDKNGRRIFEGDVVSDGIENLFKVTYSEVFQFHFICISSKHHKDLTGGISDLYTLHKNYKLEVVGNIFDNPELLEGEQEE